MVTPYFLDANALIALLVTDHPHYPVMRAWLHRRVTGLPAATRSPRGASTHDQGTRVRTTPTVEGALIRFLIRRRISAENAITLLATLHTEQWHEFQSDSLSYTRLRPDGVIGHKQVTDAYLAEQVRQRCGKLVTLDSGLRSLHPDIAVDPAA